MLCQGYGRYSADFAHSWTCAQAQDCLNRPSDAVVAQWQSTPLVRVRSRVQSSLTAPSDRPMHNKHRLINMPVLLNGPYNKALCTLRSPSHNSLPGGETEAVARVLARANHWARLWARPTGQLSSPGRLGCAKRRRYRPPLAPQAPGAPPQPRLRSLPPLRGHP